MANLILPSEPTVYYSEMHGSPRESMSGGKGGINCQYKTAWSTRWQLVKQLCGYYEETATGSIRTLPHQCPHNTNMYCQGCEIEPFGSLVASPANAQVAEYEAAIINARYETLQYIVPTDQIIATETLEPSAEFITLSNIPLFWAAGEPLKRGEIPSMIINTIDWVYTIHKVKTIPTWVFTLPGSINSDSVISLSLNRTFPAYSLLANNPTLRHDIDSDGSKAWTVTFRMTIRTNDGGWRKYPRPSQTNAGQVEFATVYALDENRAPTVEFKLYPEVAFSQFLT